MNSENIKYLTVGLKELNHKHQFYFDANDLIHVIQGISRFYESPSGMDFQKSIFDDDYTVIYSLLISGFLGETIKLLPPHQAELSDKLKKGTLFKKINKELSNQFLLKDTSFFEKLKEIKDVSINEQSNEFLTTWVNQKGKEIFNSIYATYKLSFQERFIELHENNIIHIESYDLDDIEIYNQELFNSLSDAFNTDNYRGKEDKSENNFRDVIALMYLAKKVKSFNKDSKKPIPIFFDSQNFVKIIPQSLLREYFTIRYNGTESLALRSHNYFKIFSLLTLNYPYPNRDKPYEEFLNHQKIIENLISDLNHLETIESILGTQNSLEVKKQELDEKINEYFNYDFFNSILLKTFINRKEILDKIFQDSQKTEFDYTIIEKLKIKVDAILEKFNSEINDLVYNSASVYKSIEQRFKYVKELSLNLKAENKVLDIFHDYSLFRFFIPEKPTNSLNLLFSEDGILSSNLSTSRASLTTIWNLYYRTINNKTDLEEYELFDLYATFWILNLHELVIQFKYNFSKLHHSLLMLKGACLNRAILELKGSNKPIAEHIKSIEKIIDVLKIRLQKVNEKDMAFGEINIVISYLYFHLWINQGNKLTLEGGKEISNTDANGFNHKAIYFAQQAYNYFEIHTSENNPLRIYALNIYIYFVIDTSTIKHFFEIKDLRQEFIRLKGKTKNWHFRYDDTIARNFHRQALLQNTNEEKLEFLQKAIDILKETTDKHIILKSRDINEVRAYLDSLIDLKAELKTIDKNQ